MGNMSRSSGVAVAASLALSLIFSSGATATDATTTSSRAHQAMVTLHPIVILKQFDKVSPVLAGFGTSPGGRTASPLAACAKGKHFPDPTIV